MTPLQQPVLHEVAVHLHVPWVQLWPAAHAAPAPQWQKPFEQVSVTPEHWLQAAPPVPQAVALCPLPVMQTPALQQPVGQLVASQVQAPPTQRVPGPQAALMPHLHAPPEQLSALLPQAEQVPPFAPH